MQLSLLTSAILAFIPIITASPISSGKGVVTVDGTYIQAVLDHHNIHRLNHSAPLLTWSHRMHYTARLLAETCNFGHNTSYDGGGYGQNIAAGTIPQNISSIITDSFYNNEMPLFQYYGQANPDNYVTFESWGHFTQIVWKHTLEVGCYTYDCGPAGFKNLGKDIRPYYTVCNYWPPGNIDTEFGTNVGKPLGMEVTTPMWKPAPGFEWR